MRKIILLPLAAAVGWFVLTLVTVAQPPVVEVAAAPACTTEAEAWRSQLTTGGFEVEPASAVSATAATVQADAGPCLAGRISGFRLEGAVPAEFVKYLIRKRPRGVLGLTVVDVEPGQVMTLDADGGRTPFVILKKKG